MPWAATVKVVRLTLGRTTGAAEAERHVRDARRAKSGNAARVLVLVNDTVVAKQRRQKPFDVIRRIVQRDCGAAAQHVERDDASAALLNDGPL